MRLFAMIFMPLLMLGIVESGLRVAGYGYDTHFFQKIQIKGQSYYVPNEKFSYRFFPPAIARETTAFRFPADKATNSYRIFLLGESAAMGDPDASYGFGRYLEVLLHERYLGTDFQVVCVAVTAIDSSTILPIARECARQQGDLWLIYMGNNEMVGPFGAETSYGMRAPNRALIHTILAIKTTRLGQLFDSVIRNLSSRSAKPQKWGGMEMFANNRLGYDEPARLRAYANFKANLEDILRAAHKADVPVILSTMAVNLKQCAPFASMHAADLNTNQESDWNRIYETGVDLENENSNRQALAFYQKAAAIDPQFADLQYRMGGCELALTNDEAARKDLEQARDDDALDFRADTRINSAIREAASRHAGQGVYFLDAAGALAQHSPQGIPGLNFFYEHVHLNFAGNYFLALNFAEQMQKILPTSVTAHDKGNWASEKICDDRLAVTVWDRQRDWQEVWNRITAPPFTGQFNHDASLAMYEKKMDEVKLLLNAQTPAQARQMYEQAIAASPDDYFLHGNFERFLEKGGFLAQAIVEAKRCCELVPQTPGGYYYVGTLLVRDGRISEATNYFSRALAIQGNYEDAEVAMGEIRANEHKTAEAVRWFKRAIRSNPTEVDAYLDLGFLQQNEGEKAAATANYQKAANLEPEGPADYFERANAAADSFQWDEAIADLRGVVKARPEFWQAHYMLGIELAGDETAAQREFDAVVHDRPDFAPAHLSLGTILAAEKKSQQALAQFRIVLQLDPANRSARQQIETMETGLHQSH